MKTITLSLICSLILATFSLTAQVYEDPTTGNVGIGTNTPQYKMQLSGSHNNTNVNLHYHHFDPALQADLTLWASEPGWTYTGAGIGNNVCNSQTNAGIVRINNQKGGSYIRLLDQELKFNIVKSDGTDIPAMTLDGTGNVGIGMASPLTKLSIVSNNALPAAPGLGYGVLHIKPFENATDQLTGLTFGANIGGANMANGAQAGIYVQSSGNYGTNMFFGTTDNYSIGSKVRMVINAAGNVGIGTNGPTEKLSVNGKIRAQEIKVETANWPDYVFARDYSLPSLAEIEKHIKEKGHLQGIPSAKEAEADGIDLGEMNAKLLKKIEELTLHLIEKDKEIQLIKSDYKELRNMILDSKAKVK